MKLNIKTNLKLLTIILTASMLGGCAAKSSANSDNSQTNSTSSSSVISAPVSEASEASSPPADSTPTPENWEDFIGADGLPVAIADATVDEMGLVTFDYSIVRYLPAVYDDTFKNPALINWETMEFEPLEGEYKPTFARLKKGDVLENGLEVTEAYRTLEYAEMIDEATFELKHGWDDYFGEVTFKGEITLSGALYCVAEDDYMIFGGELYFFPDTTEFSQMPAQTGFAPAEARPLEIVYPDAQFAVRCGTMYYVGNVDDYDLEGIIERGKAASVTVTLDNIRLETASINRGGRGGSNFAKLADVKPR